MDFDRLMADRATRKICPGCEGPHDSPALGHFCSSYGVEFNEWYRMGVTDWVAERTRQGLATGEDALIEWAETAFPKITCAECGERKVGDKDDYLCRDCRV